MLEAGLGGDPVTREQSQLRGAIGEALERRHSVDRRDLANGVHLGVDVERRQPGGASVKVGNPVTQLPANLVELLAHRLLPCDQLAG